MKIYLKRLLGVLILSAFALQLGAVEAPKREVRSVWLTTVWGLDWPATQGITAAAQSKQKQQLINYLDDLKDMRMNTIYFQVRSMCDAMYKSSYEPWSSYLTGERGADPGWDPLAFAVEECHKRGMECHAWINPYRFSTGTDWNTNYDTKLVNEGYLLTYGTTIILNPALEKARKRIVDVCKEIAVNYKVDGLIFDDYFYPNGIPATSSAEDYDLWKNSGTSLSFGDWRRANVNLMVREVYEMVQANRPDIRFGISPAGVAGKSNTSASDYNVNPCPVSASDWQYNGIYSDPLAWLSEGTIDYISPQCYWPTTHSTAPFGPLSKWWSYIGNHFGRHFYASHSISLLGSANTQANWADIAKQINFSRQYTENNATGTVFYSAAYINGSKASGLGAYLKANTFTSESLTPVITWKQAYNYNPVSNLAQNSSNLSWTKVENGNAIIKYTVYAIPLSVSTADAKATDSDGFKKDYLLGVTFNNAYTIPTDKVSGYWYAVCVYDGYANEHKPATINCPEGESDKAILTSPINGAVAAWNCNFTWNAIANATYSIEISATEDFANVLLSKQSITTNSVSIDLGTLSSSTRYYWRVLTVQTGKMESTSNVASFTTSTRESAAKASLIYPADGESFKEDITFSWSKEDVSLYMLQVSPNYDFSTIKHQENVSIESAVGNVIECKVAISRIGRGSYYWRVVTMADNKDNTASDIRTFTVTELPIGNFEQGYTIKYDQKAYADVNKYRLENLWFRSTKTGYDNIQFESIGSYNRGICAVGDYVYMSGRSENATGANLYLRKFDGATGEILKDIKIVGDAGVLYYPCNDVIKDSYDNICITNLSLNIANTPLMVFEVDKETGVATERASCTMSGLSSARVDHAAIYGNLSTGNFTVYAAISSTNVVARWRYENGTLAATEKCTLKSFYPSSSSTAGIAPRLRIINDDKFYIDGGEIAFSCYSFSTGALVESFASNEQLAPTSFNANGGAVFATKDNFIVYPVDDHSGSAGYRFNLVSINSAMNFSSMSLMWTFPESGLGSVNSTTMQANAEYVKVNDRYGVIYIFVPGCGLAAYKLTDTSMVSVEDNLSQSAITITAKGNKISINTIVDTIEVYNTAGVLLKKVANTNSTELNTVAGVYIVKAIADNDEAKQIVIIK
ncbi:MAG: family 10 glycosylhydrolase [Muribaculaceae bacterium]|nr:family 10 glycosylhydrolase [Muribaculaceae bacterium]